MPRVGYVPVGTPLNPYDRAAQRRQWLRRIYREPGAFPSPDVVKVCTVSLQGRVQLVEERIVDDPYNRLFLVQEADRDARKGEAVHEVGSSVCERDLIRRCASSFGQIKIPIGSTQKVGASVKDRRVPSVYDSSPMLIRSGRM